MSGLVVGMATAAATATAPDPEQVLVQFLQEQLARKNLSLSRRVSTEVFGDVDKDFFIFMKHFLLPPRPALDDDRSCLAIYSSQHRAFWNAFVRYARRYGLENEPSQMEEDGVEQVGELGADTADLVRDRPLPPLRQRTHKSTRTDSTKSASAFIGFPVKYVQEQVLVPSEASLREKAAQKIIIRREYHLTVSAQLIMAVLLDVSWHGICNTLGDIPYLLLSCLVLPEISSVNPYPKRFIRDRLLTQSARFDFFVQYQLEHPDDQFLLARRLEAQLEETKQQTLIQSSKWLRKRAVSAESSGMNRSAQLHSPYATPIHERDATVMSPTSDPAPQLPPLDADSVTLCAYLYFRHRTADMKLRKDQVKAWFSLLVCVFEELSRSSNDPSIAMPSVLMSMHEEAKNDARAEITTDHVKHRRILEIATEFHAFLKSRQPNGQQQNPDQELVGWVTIIQGLYSSMAGIGQKLRTLQNLEQLRQEESMGERKTFFWSKTMQVDWRSVFYNLSRRLLAVQANSVMVFANAKPDAVVFALEPGVTEQHVFVSIRHLNKKYPTLRLSVLRAVTYTTTTFENASEGDDDDGVSQVSEVQYELELENPGDFIQTPTPRADDASEKAKKSIPKYLFQRDDSVLVFHDGQMCHVMFSSPRAHQRLLSYSIMETLTTLYHRKVMPFHPMLLRLYAGVFGKFELERGKPFEPSSSSSSDEEECGEASSDEPGASAEPAEPSSQPQVPVQDSVVAEPTGEKEESSEEESYENDDEGSDGSASASSSGGDEQSVSSSSSDGPVESLYPALPTSSVSDLDDHENLWIFVQTLTYQLARNGPHARKRSAEAVHRGLLEMGDPLIVVYRRLHLLCERLDKYMGNFPFYLTFGTKERMAPLKEWHQRLAETGDIILGFFCLRYTHTAAGDVLWDVLQYLEKITAEQADGHQDHRDLLLYLRHLQGIMAESADAVDTLIAKGSAGHVRFSFYPHEVTRDGLAQKSDLFRQLLYGMEHQDRKRIAYLNILFYEFCADRRMDVTVAGRLLYDMSFDFDSLDRRVYYRHARKEGGDRKLIQTAKGAPPAPSTPSQQPPKTPAINTLRLSARGLTNLAWRKPSEAAIQSSIKNGLTGGSQMLNVPPSPAFSIDSRASARELLMRRQEREQRVGHGCFSYRKRQSDDYVICRSIYYGLKMINSNPQVFRSGVNYERNFCWEREKETLQRIDRPIAYMYGNIHSNSKRANRLGEWRFLPYEAAPKDSFDALYVMLREVEWMLYQRIYDIKEVTTGINAQVNKSFCHWKLTADRFIKTEQFNSKLPVDYRLLNIKKDEDTNMVHGEFQLLEDSLWILKLNPNDTVGALNYKIPDQDLDEDGEAPPQPVPESAIAFDADSELRYMCREHSKTFSKVCSGLHQRAASLVQLPLVDFILSCIRVGEESSRLASSSSSSSVPLPVKPMVFEHVLEEEEMEGGSILTTTTTTTTTRVVETTTTTTTKVVQQPSPPPSVNNQQVPDQEPVASSHRPAISTATTTGPTATRKSKIPGLKPPPIQKPRAVRYNGGYRSPDNTEVYKPSTMIFGLEKKKRRLAAEEEGGDGQSGKKPRMVLTYPTERPPSPPSQQPFFKNPDYPVLFTDIPVGDGELETMFDGMAQHGSNMYWFEQLRHHTPSTVDPTPKEPTGTEADPVVLPPQPSLADVRALKESLKAEGKLKASSSSSSSSH